MQVIDTIVKSSLPTAMLLGLLFTSAAIALNAGQHTSCAFDDVNELHHIQRAEHKIQAGVAARKSSPDRLLMEGEPRTIPVVVHVLHEGGNANIAREQIARQIEIINEDYGKISGTNGDGQGVDTEIRFCLAKIDPDGNCTDGIVRINTPLTHHQAFQRPLLTELSFWDNTRYVNIYVVKSILGSVDGYSSFPDGPAREDGIVIRHDRFGAEGFGSTAQGLGRTLTHELGHWLGLFHVFQDGCGSDICLDGDKVCDTPPASVPHFECKVVNSCSIDMPDVNDPIENYMDYTPDACKNMFSQGQKERMLATLDNIRTEIWSQQNLIATGCNADYQAPDECPIVADFVCLTREICTGNAVYFMDVSLNGATSWNWEFEGGEPAQSNQPNPTVLYESTGSFKVSLTVNNASGSDSYSVEDYIVVRPPGNGRAIPLLQNFDDGQFPPENITIVNSDGGVSWELDSAAAHSGRFSVRINNLINTNYGSTDEMVLPYLDFSTAHPDSNFFMRFEWAYARSDRNISDDLLVLLSTDCGLNFVPVLNSSGSSLVTAPTTSEPFVPTESQWRTAHINLNSYRNETYAQLKFVNVTDGGNNLYIDNIRVTDGREIVTHAANPGGHNNQDIRPIIQPNPVIDQATLVMHSINSGTCSIQISDMLGRIVTPPEVLQLEQGVTGFSLNLTGLKSGVYYAQLTGRDWRQVVPLVVRRD